MCRAQTNTRSTQKDAKLVGSIAKREEKKKNEEERKAQLTFEEKADEKQAKKDLSKAKAEAKKATVAGAKARLGII